MDRSIYTKEWERQIYNDCKDKGYFEIEGNSEIFNEKYFCIMMPPPNITGVLHIGHALTFTLQDIIVRYKRMQGFKTLWQPGLDHAGIATQNVVEKKLLSKGITKEFIGREKFIEEIWKWKEQSGGEILSQMQRLGFSPAFNRLRFTMDDGLVNAVKEVFIKWYEEGLIYRGTRMINWCTHDGALSDIEVEYRENNAKLYHIKYFLENKKDFLVVATTRPETFFGDSAVMVNPDDERYTHLIGKSVFLPLTNKEIKVIADSHVDKDFGSGVVKVTPAHDNNDYEVGIRHNLESIIIFDKNGILNEKCLEFSGMERLEAREKIAQKLDSMGFIEKIEEYKNKVGICYRCGNIIEPYISKQWFVKAEIAKGAINRIASGEARFYPSQWKNNYNAWMRDLKDWCISRQLWWGHRIPVFYCECGHEFASSENTPLCPVCNTQNITQDPDVLDTWFSSGIWTHSTLGYKNGDFGKGTLWNEDDLENFHPNNLLITGFDILFFWVARMLLSSDKNINEIAFKDIYLHALVCDEFGNKMSKSKGNVLDPLLLCEEYSADIIRFSLAFLAVQGRDIRVSKKQFEITKNFTNKLINAANFLQLYANQIDENFKFEIKDKLSEFKTPVGRYMKSRLNENLSEIIKALDSYRFDLYANIVYRFLWNEFCDIGVELAKANKESIFELASVFLESMKILSPLMPFLSEFLFASLLKRDIKDGLGIHKSIMIEKFPSDICLDKTLEKDFKIILDSITTIRRIKTNFELGKELKNIFLELREDIGLENFKDFILKLAKIEGLEIVHKRPNEVLSDIGEFVSVHIESKNLDLEKIKTRSNNQLEKLLKEISKLESMLKNDNFIKNAPKELIESNHQNLKNTQNKLNELEKFISQLQNAN